jgi:hypothetical protein
MNQVDQDKTRKNTTILRYKSSRPRQNKRKTGLFYVINQVDQDKRRNEHGYFM